MDFLGKIMNKTKFSNFRNPASFEFFGNTTRIFFFTAIFILLIFLLPEGSQGVLYRESVNQEVEEGEEAYYFIRATNNDHPEGVTISIEVEQDISGFDLENNEFTLNYIGDSDSCHIYVYTKGIRKDTILTKVRIYEKSTLASEKSGPSRINYTTTIIHPEKSESDQNIYQEGSNLIILAAGIGMAGMVLYYVVGKKGFTIPFFSQYSRLRHERLLKHKLRNQLYVTVVNNPEGIRLKTLMYKLNIQHPNKAHYHLQRLVEFDYLRKIANTYYPTDVNFRKPMKGRIEDAIETGAKTPKEIAKKIKSRRQNVWYYIKKYNLLRKNQ